jgi:exosome complex RNA-binding protein Rrp4
MVGMIREYCKSDVIVGKNGRLYAKGGDLGLVAMAVKKICNEAHLEGLTDRTKEFLEKESRQSPAGGEVVGQSV